LAERDEEEAHVTHEPAPLDDNDVRASTAAAADDEAGDGGHEERALNHVLVLFCDDAAAVLSDSLLFLYHEGTRGSWAVR
jgi:hypothetical protein